MEFEAQLYARLLYPLGHGYALWCPEPNEALPAEYTREGIRLGDVGLITLDGGFDFLFNICLPADDPINRSRGTPEQFRPLPCDGQVFQNSHFFKPGEPVYSRRATCRQISVGGSATIPAFPIGAGAGIEISFSNNSGAVLMIPTDSARVDILQRRAFREYAQAHAASWYQFANDTLGRDAENGSIYLVTGHDKSTAWENAVFDSSYSSQSCTFMFEPGGIVGGQMKLSQSSILQSSVRHRCSFLHHQSQLRQNQALFIRGFRVSIRQGLSVRFRGGVKVSGTYTSTAKDILGPVPRLSQAGSSFSMSWGAPSGSSRSGDMDTGLTDDDYKAYNSSSMVVDSPNSSDSDRNHDSPSNGSDTTSIGEDDYLPPSQLHHPLIFINNDILKNDPKIDVVVTHDDDWIALLISEDTEMPDDETLARRFYEKYSVFESDGCAVLKLRLLDLYNPPLVEIRSLIRSMRPETIDYTREAISRQFPAQSPSNDLFSTLDDDDLCLCPDSPLLAEHLEVFSSDAMRLSSRAFPWTFKSDSVSDIPAQASSAYTGEATRRLTPFSFRHRSLNDALFSALREDDSSHLHSPLPTGYPVALSRATNPPKPDFSDDPEPKMRYSGHTKPDAGLIHERRILKTVTIGATEAAGSHGDRLSRRVLVVGRKQSIPSNYKLEDTRSFVHKAQTKIRPVELGSYRNNECRPSWLEQDLDCDCLTIHGGSCKHKDEATLPYPCKNAPNCPKRFPTMHVAKHHSESCTEMDPHAERVPLPDTFSA